MTIEKTASATAGNPTALKDHADDVPAAVGPGSSGPADAGHAGSGARSVVGDTAVLVGERRPGSIAHAAAWLAKQVEIGVGVVDLSPSQYRTLIVLGNGSAVSSFLADRLDVRPPSVTAVIDGLVARGLVVRQQSEDDRRCVTHVLTDQGRRVLARADEALDDRLVTIASMLESDELSTRAIDDLSLWRHALLEHHRSGVRR